MSPVNKNIPQEEEEGLLGIKAARVEPNKTKKKKKMAMTQAFLLHYKCKLVANYVFFCF